MRRRGKVRPLHVIPGRPAGPNPESILPVVVMDSGFADFVRALE